MINNPRIAIFNAVLAKDQFIMVKKIEAETGIPRSTVHRILTELLFKKKVAVRWVPHALIDTQKMPQNSARTFKVVQ